MLNIYGRRIIVATKWKLEDDVNDYVKSTLEALGLKKLVDYNEECLII